MNIKTQKTGGTLAVSSSGKLDATTLAAFDNELRLDGIDRLVLNFNECDYISSLGLRSILDAHKK